MEIYRENISYFLNCLGMMSLFLFEPTAEFIIYNLPYTFVIPMVWGLFIAIVDGMTDWNVGW